MAAGQQLGVIRPVTRQPSLATPQQIAKMISSGILSA